VRPHSKESFSAKIFGLFSVTQPDAVGRLIALSGSAHEAAVLLQNVAMLITGF
jgi:hypothetical protein